VEIAERMAIDPEAAVALALEAVEQRTLRSDFLLTSGDGKSVAVWELLAHPDVWHGRRFRPTALDALPHARPSSSCR